MATPPPAKPRGYGHRVSAVSPMMQLNDVKLIGFVSRDPILVEPRARPGLPTRPPYIKLVLAVGVRVSETYQFTDFHHVAVFPSYLVDVVTKYVRKGDYLMIQGILRQRPRLVASGKYLMSARVEVYSRTGRLVHMGIPKIFSEDVRAMRAKKKAEEATEDERRELAASILHLEENFAGAGHVPENEPAIE
jgi:single-stranded DNA-binding protein